MVCACCAARSPLFPRFVCVRISFLPKVLLGDMGAGKSSLVLRFVKGKFTDYQESTIGAAFLTKTLPELSVKFEIWDTAGQERYHSLAPMYYRGAAAAIVVYDMTSADSFKRAKDWVKVRNLGTSPLCPHRPVLCFDICERHKKSGCSLATVSVHMLSSDPPCWSGACALHIHPGAGREWPMLESLSNADLSTGTPSLCTFCHPAPPLH